MIKRTVYFSKPAYLSLKNRQLVAKITEDNGKSDSGPPASSLHTMPIEDLGVVILDNFQITISQALLSALISNNVAVVTCDGNRMPTALHLPLDHNTLQSERFSSHVRNTSS